MTESSPFRPIRRHRTLEEAAALVAEWWQSGLQQEAFCHAKGLLQSVLQSSLKRTCPSSGSPPPTGFVELRPASATMPSSGIVIEIAGGMRITGMGVGEVVELLSGLRRGGA